MNRTPQVASGLLKRTSPCWKSGFSPRSKSSATARLREVRQYDSSFRYQAQSWNKPRHVVAKVEWHPGELYPRVGFIVTNLARSAEGVVAFCNQRGTCEQYIKEGKNAIKWTRLSCRTFAANAVRLQLHALAYNLANFMRTLAMPKTADQGNWVKNPGMHITEDLATMSLYRH